MTLLVLVFVVWLATVVNPSAQPLALALAGLVAAVSPLVLRYVKLDGPSMSALSYLTALVIAVVAEYLVGDLSWPPTQATIVAALLGSSGLWTIQQAAYAALRQWGSGISLWVTTPPAPVTPKP